MAMRLPPSELAAWVAAASEGSSRFLMGVAGPPGSGKSTLAATLGRELRAPVVPMDGFHLSDAELDRLGWRDVKGAPQTFDVAGFGRLLHRLRVSDEDVWAPRFDREREKVVPAAIRVGVDAPIVVVEGNYLLLDEGAWSHVRGLLDATAFLDVPRDELRRRLVARHVDHGRTPAAAAEWVDRSDLVNAVLVNAHARHADVVVDGSPGTG